MSGKLWKFGTREVVFAAIGAALYGVLSYLTALLQIPGSQNVSFRPAVAIVFFFGIAFGPLVGFITGFLGNVIADLLFGGPVWWWWALGNGVMGLVAGLLPIALKDFNKLPGLIKAEILVVAGAAVGMAVAAISELWVSGVDVATTISINFLPAFLTNIVFGLILVPVFLIAYSAIVKLQGR